MASRLFSKDVIFKNVNSGTRLISELAHDTVKHILYHCPNERLIPIFSQLPSYKNATVRSNSATYLQLILARFPKEVMLKEIEHIETFLEKTLGDASEEARREARHAWFEFERSFPLRASKMMDYLEGSVIKAIEDDVRRGTPTQLSELDRVPSKIQKMSVLESTSMGSSRPDSRCSSSKGGGDLLSNLDKASSMIRSREHRSKSKTRNKPVIGMSSSISGTLKPQNPFKQPLRGAVAENYFSGSKKSSRGRSKKRVAAQNRSHIPKVEVSKMDVGSKD